MNFGKKLKRRSEENSEEVETNGVSRWSSGDRRFREHSRRNPRQLYERLGGMPAIHAVVDDLVTRILADERVNNWFAHAGSSPEMAAAYKAKLADFLCQGTGGPCRYAGADITTAHKGRGITEEAFNAVVEDLGATLDKFHVPMRCRFAA